MSIYIRVQKRLVTPAIDTFKANQSGQFLL